MTKKINATRRKRIRNKRNKRKSNKIKRKKSYRIKRVNKYKKKQEGGTNLIRGNLANPYKIPDENMMFITGDKKDGYIKLTDSHFSDFNNMIDQNHPDSQGFVKVYMIFTFFFDGVIFHPIIGISRDINENNKTYQMREEGREGKAFCKEMLAKQVQEESLFRIILNIRAMVYIGYFVDDGQPQFESYLKGEVDDPDLEPAINDEYYSQFTRRL